MTMKRFPSPLVTKRMIADALDKLQIARIGGDDLTIDLAESALNNLLERYRCHTCHGSPEGEK